MNIKQFIADLSQQGVKLWVEGEQLRVNAPKGVLTAETRDLLVKNKAELILLLHQKNAIATDTDLPLIKAERTPNIPLSFGQEQIWLLNQLEPNNPFYNEQAALRLHGNLNVVALEQSLNKIIARHEALRTNFRTFNEQPVQVIAESLTLNLSVVDLTELPESEREIACQQLATAETIRPFDLASSGLIRASVLKITEVEHVLLLTLHHIVFDAWSVGVLMRELATIYSALCNNLSPQLPELQIQYADFAIWQRQWLQTEVLQTQLNYWQQLLKNAPSLLELPTDRPRPAIQTFRGARQHIKLSIELSEALVNFSKQERATLFTTLFAAFVTLLYRYTGSDDILVGTPTANRDRLEIEELIGFFVNTLVLRTDLSGNPSFKQLLSRVHQLMSQAYAHSDLPFEELVKALQPERDLSYTPLFQVMFLLQNASISQGDLTGLTVSPLATERTTAKFDLTLFMENTSTGLVGTWEYNTDLFDAATIERMAGHFVTLLEGIVANPQQLISQLPLLTKPEQQKLLVEWNDTQAEYPCDRSIHQLFEEQVERTPDAVAVVFENQQLTYYELNCRANQLAHYLKSLGVKADVLVGLCVERSLEMVVGLLGILKAGGAYVPLDPEYPTERLSFMLEDAQISVLLTQQLLLERLPEHQAHLVCLDTDWQLISPLSQDNPATDVQATNLGYVIYTSGSTGQPKGVAMNQLPLCNLILWQLQNMKISSGAKTLQFAPISFDVSFQEIFSTWFSGGTLLLIGEELRRDALALLSFLQEKAIERLFLPFVALQQLAEIAVSESVTSHLREIITAGEQLQITPAISQWLSKLSDCTLYNHYGPSESHVVTTFTLTNSADTWPLLPPIGRPIANTQIYILDEYLQPVPVGVAGELYIGGVPLARGYFNRPELTQEKFIPNPFSTDTHSRLYKTGDLARYLADGNIEYLGRIDNQVKIRGFRIELGEIEAVLSQHGDVQASCVIAREDTLGDKRLVAYVVPHQHCTLTISELRHFLKAKLPEYMIPNGFAILESLPLTPSGKVDRRALPVPDLHSEQKDKYIAPRSPIEEMLAQIWAQVLKVEQVGIDDNFFELGGHSLLATQLVSRIRNIFKVELALRELFIATTVAELAHVIGQLLQQNLESAPPILPRAKNAELPLSYAQQRLWFLDQLKPDSALYNIPIALRLVGTLKVIALEQSLQSIITRHEALHTNFVIVDGQPTQIIHTETNWRISVKDLQYLSPTEQEIAGQQLAQKQAIQPFDLASEALVRVTLVVLSETEHLMLVCMHHVVSDAWSIGVFVQELVALYNAYSQSQPSLRDATRIAPLPVQYADFAIWQRQYLKGDVLQTQLGYWQEQLANAPALLLLPSDRPRPAVQTFNGAHQEFTLSVELTQKLTKLSQQQGVTLFMTLLAAFDILLYRYTGTEDILVGSSIANRNRSEIEGLIGFFVNTLVMRTNLTGNPSFSELLGRVREMAMDAYAHQDLPFEMLVEALQPQRDLSHTPLFQVMFTLQNAPMSSVELAGLTVSSLPAESATAKFDLTLLMENTAAGLVGVWEYSTDLFDASTIERMVGHFVTLLEGIVANPEERISQLPLLIQPEQHQLLVEWNLTQADYLKDKCIHQLFEEQVERTPHAVAVVFENQQLTYQQLNCRANQLAHYLQSLGVEADVLVGLCVERSLEMMVGLLGILKAGGAYVPLDPDYPQERLAYMLNDSQVRVLLTQEKLLTSLPEHGARIVCLDTDWEDISTESKDNPISSLTTDNLAYVIYTSGSTGQPKGTLINHSNVIRLFEATNSWYHFNSQDVWTLFHSYAFDFSVWEIWGALLYGGRLVVVPYLVTREPESFYKLLCQEKVTILNQTPSAFRQLIQAEQSIAIAGDLNLRLVIFGGEALELKSLQPWFERHGDRSPQLVNMYGITETTVHVTYRPLSKADLNGAASVIGRPIPDLQVYVLDEHLQPVPIGVAGEMYVGGAGVARGYLNRPELTAQRFISHPFNDNPKARLYKSGDKARYLPNGELEYLGRIDQQVKIRGFRIELGEIEALLAQHPAVWESVVMVRSDEPGDKRLVAYVVPQLEQSPTAVELRRFLKQKLPEYMLPTTFVQLEALPLTANGKVDRRALPAPNTARPELEDVFVAPSTPEEKILAAIWAKVLSVEQVGINDNFFTLGGDSIRSIQVLSQAREQGLSFSVQQLFQHQTIHELVEELQTQENDITKLELTQPFSLISQADKQQLPNGVEDAYPLAMLQMGMIYHSEYSQDSTYHDIFSFHLKTPLDVKLLQVAIQDLVNHHAVLRTSFELSNFSIPLQLVHQQVEVPLQVEDWCHLHHSEQEEALAAWFEAEKKQHFDWTHPPLVRCFVHRRTPETFNLALSFHHVILDGWSVASMMSELLKRYLSLGEQVHYPSPQLNIAFRDFVALEQQAIASSETQHYWSEKLNNSTFTKLPRWSSMSKNTNVRVGVQEVTLSPKIFEGLKQLAQSAEVPLKSVLLAAHLRVLNFLSGESDVLTGLAANGRPEQGDGERVLGLFLNTLPFRLQLSGGTWIDLVRQVFETERELLPHRRYPLAEIQRNLGGEPLFETAFNFTHFHVYQQVLGLNNLQLLGGKFFEQTNFTFLAQFSVSPSSVEAELNLKYDTDKLYPEQINSISNYYVSVLTAMANQPQGRYELHSLLSLEEQQQLLVEWNDTQADYPQDKCIHELFEEQVNSTPDAVAVVFENQQLTYHQLNSRANQLAHYLKSLGVGGDVLVGLCVERSLEMVVGMLGILKAGGAYVPLDPEYPQERLSFMLEDTQLSVVLTQEKLVNKLRDRLRHGFAERKACVICLDSNWDIINQQTQQNPTTSIKADNLAYVMYTSGSTGQPKGVSIVHRGVVRLVKQTDYVSFSAQDVIAQASNYAFDAATFEIWGALLQGARLVGVSKDLALAPKDFAAFIQAQRISVLFLTTALFNQIAQEVPYAFNTVQHLLFGGEAVDPKWVKEVLKNGAPQRLLHVYGPTENTTFTSWYLVQDVPEGAITIPIGRPISNTQIYVLDSQLQPVGVGVPGEVYIGGDGLAKEYLNRPELTQEKFFPNPFDNSKFKIPYGNAKGGQNSKLYKTGDLARYLPDGNIEYLGRIDNQVKIRGFRIELSEIETVLSQHADVQASCVIARVDTPGDKRLVAYVVAHQDCTPTISELRQFLKAKLPDYMLPNAIVILESLPLTPNGKVDRRALPAPDLHSERKDKYVAPRTPIEEMLAQIWAQVLKVEQVGIDDNFFELGGHSLLATQLVSRIRNIFKVELPLRELFAAATVSELARSIGQLQQQELESAPPLLPRDRNAELPLSFAQTRLWFLDQLEPNSAFYNIPLALRLVGTLEVAALEQSLQEIIHRHEALRTNFITVDGQPTQIIHTETNWRMPVIDWQDLSTTEQEIAGQQLVQQQAIQPFDLASEALVRATLVVLSETEHLMLVCMHHVVSDGWSMGVFVQELAVLYNAYSQGQTSPLPPLPIQYADFAIWQRNWLQGDVLQTQLSYWQQQLANAPALLSLPTDRPRPAVQTFAGAYQEFALSKELTSGLAQLSQQQGVTLFMTLLAAFDTLLYRYTGVADILVGSPIANRNRSEIEGLIGFFVNTLVMRTNLAGNPSFSELLGRVREMAMDAYAHQDLAFEMLVEALQPERDLGHTPLFQVMFILQNAPMSSVELAGLTVSSLPVESATAKFDLTLSMQNTAAGLVGVWEYRTDLFDASTIDRLTGHFVTLLEGIVTNPEERISQLPMLTQVEQQQLLVEWNDTQADYPQDRCIHQLFEEQVQRTPDAVAVVFENQQLTYHQLNCRANQLAHYLQSLGVGADVLVGLCVERSLEMVVGLLGILKAGGAYVPLDPEYPTERLSFMLEDVQASVLLTQQQLLEKLPQHQAQVVCLDTDWQLISQSSQDNPITAVQATNLAYVIYTSGSTGQPKGVMLSHRNLCNHMFWMQTTFPLTEKDKVLQKTPFSFDASVWEFYAPLLVGGQLLLAQPGGHTDSAYLLELIAQQEVTTVQFVPSLLQILIEQGGLETCHSLKQIFCGGEVLPVALQENLLSNLNVKLHNLYGPTEACIDATFWTCKQGIERQVVPIGRPIANTQIYILDEYLQPVPVGVPGELHISGAGIARGYLNCPELTKEKFIPNPFDNSKLYKTGDLARYLPDGNIEYLGRIDNQVKIRGFRIELGEIEARLSQYEDVQVCYVIAREDTTGDKRLVAYVVPHLGQTPTVSQLRSFLSGQLPTYMMPHAFVMLESLPLLPNGKVDRRALPAPDFRGELEVSFVAPRNQIEEILAQIWAEVLKVEQVGIHDNFFELGGDSILSIQIISRAKQAGLQLSLKQLFANQTIAHLATVADTIKAIAVEQGLVTGTLPLTPIQHYFFEQNLPEPHHFNQSFLLSVPSDLKPELLKQVLQQLLVHHDALRLRFTQSESTWQQIYSAVTDGVAFSQIDLSALPESEQKTAIEAKAASLQASLNLSENLVQVAFFWLGIDKKARLLIVIHHLVVDGVSWRILLEDLQTAYQQLAQGKAMPTYVNYALPAKTTSFKDWSEKLTEYAQSQTLKSEVAYWLNKSRFAVPPIPVDYTQGANTVASASTVSVSLNEAQTRALLQDVPKAYNTQINDVLLTALVLVLGKWTNSSSVLFNLEGHGREDIIDGVDLSRTIGWFTTIFPVLVELEATENPADALKSVKEQLRSIPNKGIGYGLLRYLSQDAEIATQLQAFPQAEISFNYLGQFDQLLNPSSWMQQAFESAGRSQSLHGDRSHLLDINSIIAGKRLQIDWTYSTNAHQHATIDSLAQEFLKTLQGLIAHCLSPESGGYTPSDFSLVKVSQQELDRLLTSLVFKHQSGKTNWKNIEDIYPLSPMQQGMLFESLYAPDSGVYFEQLSCTLRGKLDVIAFEQAWQQVVARHSILRTAFVWEQLTQPLQVVYRQVDVNLQTHDWREVSAREQQQQLELFLHSQRQQGFQLSQAPLMHLSLIQLSADTYQFVWSSHHLLLDGWSVPLIFKDLLYFYQAISQGKIPEQPIARSYRNYIAWLQKQDLALAEDFWRQKLQGFTAPTSLTVDKPSLNRKQLHSYNSQQIQLTVQATAALQTFARQHQLTINNLVQATWAILLCRYNQETDVVFGATVSGRPPSLVGIESMVGLFINTLPMRVQVSADTQVLALLKDLQAQQVECEQYSYSSLVEIQGWSDIPRGTPLFESIVVFENYPVDAALRSHNYSFDVENIHSIEQTNYPLTVVAAPGKQLLVKISYDTSRFDDAAIARLLGHFQTLLEGIVTNPIGQISQLPLLTQLEQHQLLVEWNNTQVDYPLDKCLHQLFEEQVERTPDAVAVEFGNQQLTYYELNCRANQLAHYLEFLGVKADVLVGICVERSLEMIVGLLGILKAGGAYVPLDSNYPNERLSFMLEDAQVQVLLTQQSLLERLPQHQAHVVCLDTDWQQSQLSQDNFISGVQANNLGYVIYTSGSTGKPKGVAMSQLALCNLILWQLENMKVSRGAKTLQFSPISFDASFHEMFSTWHSGGTLVLITEELRRDPVALLALMEDKAIERLFIPFVGLQQLAEVAVGGELFTTNLREIITAGEQLQITPAISHWLSKLTDDCTLHNHYGPSESHVVTTFTLTNSVETWPLLPPIGRPIANTQMYILDKYLQPVPIGVAGELYIGGVPLARGYLNRPQLTLEKFIPNPLSTDTHSRLYKTGDLARYLPDGNIEFLGRIDNQVKVRGFRIELGEVEAVLSQHGDVEGCCVIAREDTDGDKRLVAYVVAHQDCTPTISELRHFLKAKLPEYMVPNAFAILEFLPLTPSGKVDRSALPTFSHTSDSDKFVAPRNQLELQLVQIWSRILKVDKVGVRDNFFDLGGHSLLTPYLMAQIKQQFGKDIPIASLYQNPTIEQLATIVQADSDFLIGSPLVAIQPHGSKPPLFCLPGAAGDPFYLYNLARCLGSDQPFYSFQANALSGGSEPITQVEDIATQYIQALLVVQPQGPYFLAGHSFGGKLAFEMAQQLLRKGHKVALVAILDTTAPFYQEKPTGFDWDNAKWLAQLAGAIEVVYSKNLDISDDTLQSLVWEEQLKYVLERLKNADILPPDDEITQLNNMVQLLKANSLVNYVPQQVYPVRITFLRANETSAVEESNSEVPSEILQDLTWGWSKFSAEPVDVHFVPGNHVTMMTQPHVQVLAQRLKACIEQA